MLTHEYSSQYRALNYSNQIVGTGYLAYRDLADLFHTYLSKQLSQIYALDYGCGRGRSSKFLADLGCRVDAIDICSNMLEQAKHQTNSLIKYHLVSPYSNSLPQSFYDLVLAQLVLVEMRSYQDINKMLAEQYYYLKPGGVLIHVTAAEPLLHRHWLTIDNDFGINKTVKCGQAGKIRLINRNIELDSWYWSESLLEKSFQDNGFSLKHKHKPLGNTEDPYQWKDESSVSPYLIYVLSKP